MFLPFRPTRAGLILACLLPLALLPGETGCTFYETAPLTGARVAAALRPPTRGEVRLAAANLHHPLLRPVVFSAGDQGLSPEQAAVFAVLANPTLRSVRDARGLARAQIIQAGILPNPQVSASLDLAQGNSVPGVKNAYGLSGSWEITALFARSAKLEAARDHAASVDLSVAWQEWQAAEAAKLAVYQLASLQRQTELGRQIEQDLGAGASLLRGAVNRHEKTETDLAPAQAVADQARSDLLLLEQQESDARLMLNQTLGLPPSATPRLSANPPLPSPGAMDELCASALKTPFEEQRLDLVALRLGYESQEATLRAAVRAQFPKIVFGVSRTSDNASLKSLGPTGTVDLPFFDRNQGNIAMEKATRQQLFDDYVGRVYAARADIAKAAADLRFTAQRLAAARAALPALQQLSANYNQAMLRGGADTLVVYGARQSFNAKRLEAEKLRGDLAALLVALELATGCPSLLQR